MLTPNKIVYLSYLRNNPKNRDQGFLFFWDGANAFCALGMAADCFGLPLVPEAGRDSEDEDNPASDDYESVRDILELTDEELTEIWMLNDRDSKSFSEIADSLERRWRI